MLKRLFIAGLAVAVIAATCLAYGFLIEPQRLVVRHKRISVPGLDAPVRIAFLSDIHAGGRHVYAEDVARVVEAVHAQSPDIILLAGDYTVGSVAASQRSPDERRAVFEGHATLSRLAAPFGVFGVLGNHDHMFGADATREALGGAITFIDNKAVEVGPFCLFGIADEWFGGPRPDTERECARGTPSIGLAHNPDSLFNLRQPHSLVLAGHTHGGQINLPLLGRRVTATDAGRHYAYGRVEIAGNPAFVTAGIGMSVLPARFRAPPEIVILQLESRSPEDPGRAG